MQQERPGAPLDCRSVAFRRESHTGTAEGGGMRPAATLRRDLRSRRIALGRDARTTVHVAVYPRALVAATVVALPTPEPLPSWCVRTGVQDALVGRLLRHARGAGARGGLGRGPARRQRAVRSALRAGARLSAHRGRADDDRAARVAARGAGGGSAPGRSGPRHRRSRGAARRRGPRGLRRRERAVRLGHHRRAPPARRDRARRDPADRGRQRGPGAGRGGADACRAGVPDGRARA